MVFLCCKRKKKDRKQSGQEELVQEKVEIITEKDGDKSIVESSGDRHEKDEEKDSLLMPESPEEEPEHLVEASKPRFSSPIWLDEIHNNKIFNTQRSIINTDNLLNTPNRPDRPFPVRSISEIIEPESESEDEGAGMIVEEQKNKVHEVNLGENDNILKNMNIDNGNKNKILVPETDF